MMSFTPALIGLFGVILGVLLRPLVEDFFKRRRDSIYIEFEEGTTSLVSQNGSGLQLKINDQDVDRIFARDFVIKNRTRRTLREFEATMSFEYQQGVADRRQWITLYQSSGAEVTLISPNDTNFRFKFRRFDREGKISGRVISTYLGTLKAFTDTDIEVFVGDRAKLQHPRKFISTFLPLLVWVIFLMLYWLMGLAKNG